MDKISVTSRFTKIATTFITQDVCISDFFDKSSDPDWNMQTLAQEYIEPLINTILKRHGATGAFTVRWTNIRDEENNPDRTLGHFRATVVEDC